METIDLIALRKFSKATGQPTHPEMLDARPIEHVSKIEITEEFITIEFTEVTTRYYNANEITKREWEYKYNDDPELVAAIAKVIDLSRKHLTVLPENVSCPPGCAECCSGYEPFVSTGDLTRMAEHLGMSERDVMKEYIVERPSADGYHVGWVRKVTDDVNDKCVFLMGSRSGRYYCGIYNARPGDCRDFSPIGCQDVDEDLPRTSTFTPGAAFSPKKRRKTRTKL